MATSKQTKADKIAEQQKLIEVLKFTPRTYSIQMWGYGGEYVMGTVDRKVYDYFRSRRLDLSEFSWDSSYADDNNIPEDMWPFTPGSWYECDNMGHTNGVSMQAGTVEIRDENGDTVFQRELESVDGCDGSPALSCNDEVWIGSKPDGTVVFVGASHEKGTFFEGEIDLTEPFDPEKLCINYDDFDDNEIVCSVEYEGNEIDNNGGGTNGKSSDFGFYIAGSLKNNQWEKYRNMDDIDYQFTEWFPKKIAPVREGVYNIKTTSKDSYQHTARWTGAKWTSTWNDDEIKIKEWQGIAYDPDEHNIRNELNNIILETE